MTGTAQCTGDSCNTELSQKIRREGSRTGFGSSVAIPGTQRNWWFHQVIATETKPMPAGPVDLGAAAVSGSARRQSSKASTLPRLRSSLLYEDEVQMTGCSRFMQLPVSDPQ